VLVAGATGNVGRHVVDALVAAGLAVRAAAASAGRAPPASARLAS
jgi:uncharacterized protein YbjT (DUF2867 family)